MQHLCTRVKGFPICLFNRILFTQLCSLTSTPPPSPQTKELPTYKDNDFINDGQKIYIGEENKKMFLEKLKNDVEVCKLFTKILSMTHDCKYFLVNVNKSS